MKYNLNHEIDSLSILNEILKIMFPTINFA